MKWMVSFSILVGAVLVIWLVGQALGFQVSVVGSLLLSIALTVVVNLALRAFGTRRV